MVFSNYREFNLATELDRQKSDSQATIQSLQSQLNEKIGELQKERKKVDGLIYTEYDCTPKLHR